MNTKDEDSKVISFPTNGPEADSVGLTPEYVIGVADKLLDDIDTLMMIYINKEGSLGVIHSDNNIVTILGMINIANHIVLNTNGDGDIEEEFVE